MNIKLEKAKDELAKLKSESEVTMMKCFDAFLRNCVSASAHRGVTCGEGPAVEC